MTVIRREEKLKSHGAAAEGGGAKVPSVIRGDSS